MTIEDRIREAMSAHEHEAPSAAEFRADRVREPRAPRRHTGWLAAATAACVVAVAVLVAVVARPGSGGHRGAASPDSRRAALACPASYRYSLDQPWVPAPARGVDAAHRLVPNQTPRRVVLCAYLPGHRLPGPPQTAGSSGPALSGSKDLGGDLAAVTKTLTWLPGRLPHQSTPCTSDLRLTDGDAYLVGLTYPDGTVWVSAPGNHCEGASNGEFEATRNLLPWVAASYAAGAWVLDPAPTGHGPGLDPCLGRSPQTKLAGRLGQESSMVPPGSTSVLMCAIAYSSGRLARAPVTTTAGLPKLVAALNAVPTRTSTSACEGNGSQDVFYELVFSYAEGPGVLVRVFPHCTPGIDNGSLQAFPTGAVLSLIKQLLAAH